MFMIITFSTLLLGIQGVPTTSTNVHRHLHHQPLAACTSNPNPVLEDHRQTIIKMATEAWKSIGTSSRGNLPQAIASLSTLWLMDLQVEFADTVQLLDIESELYGRVHVAKQLAEEGLGALLSAYVLSGEKQLLERAIEVAMLYQTPELTEENRLQAAYSWMNHKLETKYLGEEAQKKLKEQIDKVEAYLNLGDQIQAIQDTDSVTLSVELKSYLQSKRQNTSTFTSYLKKVSELQSINYLHLSSRFPLAQVRHEHLGMMNIWHCLLGATLSLGSSSESSSEVKGHLQLAKAIAETCHLAQNSTASGLPYALFGIDEASARTAATAVKGVGGYALEPALAESYFVLHRLTGDPIYQKYAWELASAIYRYSRINETEGYSATMDSDQLPPVPTSPLRQPEHFISGTLKYLYLIFSPEDCFPLDKWVFNVAGHPLPICGEKEETKKMSLSDHEKSYCSGF